MSASEWTIEGARHAGITVSDLDRALDFYCGKLGLELRSRRLYEERQIAEIVAVPEATAWDIAFLRIPGGEIELELLEYKGCERHSGSARPSDYGTGHFAMFVSDIDTLYADLAARGVSFRSDGPVEHRAGPNAGAKSLYAHDPDGFIIEFTQRAPDENSTVSAVTAREQYRQMQLIRRFEERAAELFHEGVIVGTAHSCIGQEAIAVGAASAMRETDFLVGHHRSHGHLIAAGADLRRMMAEMFGKRTGYCKGLGGSMHIADLSLDILGCNGIVGAGIPHACGAGLTAKLRGSGQAVVAYFGDGAAGQGAVHEGMNLAATWKLPVVFICENNQYALSADWRTQRAVEDIADRAAGYGMPGEVVDGNDVAAVEESVARALERARAGEGPTLLELKTFRRMQHSMRANLPDVRDVALVTEWEARDPLPRLAAELGLDGDALAEIERDVAAEVEAAVEQALGDEDASPDDLLPSVFAEHRRYPEPPGPGARELGFVGAIREALQLELAADPDVVVIGEDIGLVGGLFRATEGFYEQFGRERIRDTPLTESGFVGCGIGAALTGLRPVVELQFSDFAGVAFDQILNQAAKLRFMMGGAPTMPLVLRMVSGGGVRLGAQHSQSLEALFAHIPGLVVCMPSNPYDAKGLLAAAIQDDNPVVFLEQKLLFFGEPAPVPEERYAIELGKARTAREGTDVTVVALGALVPQALRAARELEAEGISVEVLDPRTLVPLDTGAIAASVAKTHRVVVVHEAVQFGGFGGEIAAFVAEHCFWDLDAPVVRVGAPSHPIPYQKDLELLTLPAAAEITAAVRSL